MSEKRANNFVFNHYVPSNETSRMRATLWANEVGDNMYINQQDARNSCD